MGFDKMLGGSRQEGEERNANDYYPTPPLATFSFLEHCKFRGYEPPKDVHEPAAGRGWMAYELRRNKYDVVASDLYPYDDPITDMAAGFDFLKLEAPAASAMITNPPYAKDMAEKFVRHALEIGYDYVAILARTMFVESAKRYNFFNEHPPTEIMHFARRFSCNEELFFTEPLSGMVAYSWFLWDKRIASRETKTSWIETKQMYKFWTESMPPEEIIKLKQQVVTIPSGKQDALADFSHLFQPMER